MQAQIAAVKNELRHKDAHDPSGPDKNSRRDELYRWGVITRQQLHGQSLSHFFLLSNTDTHMAMHSWHKQLPVKVLTAHAQKLQLASLEQDEKSSHRNLCLLETFNPYHDSFPYLSSSDLKFHIYWEALLNTSLSNVLLTVVKTSEDWGPGTPFVDQDGLAFTM